MIYKKIKSIRNIGKRDTYDIIMKKNHNFLLANGILSHNSEVRGLIEGQDDLLLLNEMPSARDREEACDRLKKDRRMSSPQISYLSRIPVYQMVAVARKQNAKLIKRVMPPRNMCWKQGMGNFVTTWKKYKNTWININKYTDTILQEYDERKQKLAEIEMKKNEKITNDVGTKEVPEEKILSESDNLTRVIEGTMK